MKYPKSDLFYYLLFFTISILIYFNNFNHYFLSEDFNGVYKLGNYTIPQIMNSFSNFNVLLYRPFITLFNKLNFVLLGDNPFCWNTINFLLNFINTVLIFGILNYFFKKNESFFITVLFLVNFSHPEAVIWMSGRTSLLITMVFLLSLSFFLKYRKNGNKLFIFISVFIYFIGFFIKENIYIFPFILILILIIQKRKNYRILIPYFIILLIFILIRISPLLNNQSSVVNINIGFNSIKNLAYIFSGTLIPIDYAYIQDIYGKYSLLQLFSIYPVLYSLILTPVFYLILIFKGRKRALFLITLYIILSIPVVFLPGSGERYLYLPSIINSILIFALIFKNNIIGIKYKYILYTIVVIFFSFISIIKGNYWNDASYISKSIVNQIKLISNRIPDNCNIYINGFPDSYKGTYILRHGIDVIFEYIAKKNVNVLKHKEVRNAITLEYRKGTVYIK